MTSTAGLIPVAALGAMMFADTSSQSNPYRPPVRPVTLYHGSSSSIEGTFTPGAEPVSPVSQGIAAPADVSAWPGRIVSKEELAFNRTRERLRALVQKLAINGMWGEADPSGRVSPDSAKAFVRLLDCLPRGSRLPQIAPDGEGALIAHWQKSDQSTLLIIDGWELSVVSAPATPHARYHEAISFDGESMPDVLLASLAGGSE